MGVTEGVFWSDPVGVAAVVTFPAGPATRAGEGVLAALSMQALLLQQLVHPLNDALQALVNIQPYFLLPIRELIGSALQQERQNRTQTKPSSMDSPPPSTRL